MPAFKIPADVGDGEEILFLKSLEDFDPEINGAVPAPEFDRYESLGYGVNVRPHWIVPWVWRGSAGGGAFRAHGQTLACDRVKKCPGERDW